MKRDGTGMNEATVLVNDEQSWSGRFSSRDITLEEVSQFGEYPSLADVDGVLLTWRGGSHAGKLNEIADECAEASVEVVVYVPRQSHLTVLGESPVELVNSKSKALSSLLGEMNDG